MTQHFYDVLQDIFELGVEFIDKTSWTLWNFFFEPLVNIGNYEFTIAQVVFGTGVTVLLTFGIVKFIADIIT